MDDTDARALIVDKRRNGRRIFLVLERGDKVELPDRTFDKPSKWGFPGGRSDPKKDKDVVDTAIREVKEEVRVDVLIDERRRVERTTDGHTKVLFLVYDYSGEPRANKDEILDARWFPISVLYDGSFNMYHVQRQMALELLRKLER